MACESTLLVDGLKDLPLAEEQAEIRRNWTP